jgi:phosphatidylserine/phosphatidylglycerophosphate/cardiolipin synthase-like enzyme
MESSAHLIAKKACSVAAILPLTTLEMLCRWIGASPDLAAAKASIAQFPHAHYRGLVLDFLDTCLEAMPAVSTSAASLSLLSAGCSEQGHWDEHSTELVWTGPDADVVPFRRTEQAILQVLDSAQRRITLVSYAVYQIPNVRESLVRAARRGVHLQIIVETPDRHEGQNEYSTIRALGDDVAACAAVYFWPQDNRRQNDAGKIGILHVKCAVADGRWLFLSSANLTQYAFDINMELGMLVTGGKLPLQVEANFDRLIETGILERI